MLPLHITHIRPDGPDNGKVIDYYCGPDWAMEASLAIRHFNSGQKFFTYKDGKHADVVLGRSLTGRAYFRTAPDTTRLNNLGRLPRTTLLGNALAPPTKPRTTILG